ncbi:beta-xylosidase family glycoside hydrolase [Rufibacter immobilis]|uniref:beta-xylosidase family glycoside hydrolase n=1 Tax=Rufibacter immobilis TaxID=1348778 RepID=UPI0035E79A4E
MPAASNEFAGMVALQSEKHYYALGKTNSNGQEVVQLSNSLDRRPRNHRAG